MRTIVPLIALFVASAAVAAEPAPLPPVLPWKGASEALVARPGDPWITPTEASGFRQTPGYAETRAYLERLVAASGGVLTLEVFGQSAQGRDLIAIRAAKPASTPKPGASAKPVVLAQAGIHSGEIDGKDAGLMLLRDIALRGKAHLLDQADLLFVPVFNADGHERAGAFNRPNQRGPENQGWRTTAQNLNLNRDYLKADTPEMAAMLGLIQRYTPALYFDLHVTDGTDYQYDITFGYNGWDGRYAQSPAIGRWMDSVLRPALMSALAKAGHIPGGLVFAANDRKPDDGLLDTYTPARFSNGWGDLARIPTILVENHSLKPYRQRVLGTYVLLEAALKIAGADAAALQQAIAGDRAARPASIPLTWAPLKTPVTRRDFLGVAHETYLSEASGGPEVRWLGKPVHQTLDVFGDAPASATTLPVAWWVPATKPEVIARLRRQGLQVETISAPRTVTVEMLRLPEPKPGTINEGHVEIGAQAGVPERHKETYPAGSVRVPSDQPLALVAAHLLEPGSPESLLAWGYFPEIYQRTEYIEGYAIAPLADKMLAQDPALKAEFEARLAADPEFAKSPDARLEWFYQRTPYYDARYRLYPVGRELAR